MELKMEILEILAKDARATVEDMAVMLGTAAEDVRAAIAELERDRVIIQYNAVIDWNKMGNEAVQALIEVRITPQRGRLVVTSAARCARRSMRARGWRAWRSA